MRTSGSAEGLCWYAVHVFGKTTKKPCDVGRSRMDVNRLSKKAEAVKQPGRKKCGRRHPRRENYVKRVYERWKTNILSRTGAHPIGL